MSRHLASFFIFYTYLIVHHPAIGQNLVDNPGFEEFNSLSGHFTARSIDFQLPGWNSPTKGTPDYFYSSSFGDSGIPLNWAGSSKTHGGKAYAGVMTAANAYSGRTYCEYVQGSLTHALKADETYQLEFFFKLSSNSMYSCDRIGIILTDSAISRNDDGAITAEPSLELVRPPLEAGNWERVQGNYVAHGGERFFTIGVFASVSQMEFVRLSSRQGRSEMLSGSAYYYIDDVSVVSTAPQLDSLPAPNQVFIPRNLQFDFDSFVLLKSAHSELDSLVEIMSKHSTARMEIHGHADDRGTAQYNQDLSLKRAESVRDYLASRGISSNRIVPIGLSNKSPLQIGKTESARKINRRVEIKFVD